MKDNKKLSIQCLKYDITAPFYFKGKKCTKETTCMVKFQGENILKGIKEISNSNIVNGNLPDYLYKEPKTGKTSYDLHF